MKRVLAVAVAILLAACSASPIATPATSDSGGSIDPTADPTAGLAETATDLLDCDGQVSSMGGRADDFGGFDDGAATPDDAFASWIAANPFPIPRGGYRALGPSGDRWVYAYQADGRTKVVVVISPRFAAEFGEAFAIEEMRTCNPAEYGAAVDLGPGRRAWVHVETGLLLTDIEGPSHCDWQSARLLHVMNPDGTLDRQYVRDPEGVLPGPLLEGYAEDVELPADALDSGYRTQDGLVLWFTESDAAAYVVTPDGIERWPRAEAPIACR